MNVKRTLKNLGRRASDVDLDDILAPVGLARRRELVLTGVMGAVGFLVLGACVGAGIALLFAPGPGRRTRQTVEERIAGLRERFAPTSSAEQQSQQQ